MGLEQGPIKEIVNRAVSNKLDIPEFQREFVWDPQKVRFLIESLYREYPVGSFLFWDSSDYTQTKGALGEASPTWIVDGQQRTTALCLLLGRKPYWWPEVSDWNKALERFDVLANFMPDDGIVEFSLPNPVRRNDPRWFPVRDVLRCEEPKDLTPIARRLAKQVHRDPSEDEDEIFASIHGRMQTLWQVRERTIPIITIDHEPEDVAEVFARLNQAGTRVKEADVVLALAAVRNPGWVREEYLPFAQAAEDAGWDLEAGVYIRTMTGIGTGRARLKEVPTEFWDRESLVEGGVWKRTKAAVRTGLRRLAQYGLQSDELVPSNNALIPLFVFIDKWSEHPEFRFERLFRWFLLANRDGRYGGSATTALNEDVRDLTSATTPDEALAKLHHRLQSSPEVAPDEYLQRYDRAGNRFLRLMVFLCAFHAEAIDWVDGTRIGYDKTGSPITDGFKPHWHHIYPKKVLKDAGVGGDDLNALANITVMNEATNVKKLQAKPSADYIAEYNISREALTSHVIPGEFADPNRASEMWTIDRFGVFASDRAEALAAATNAYLDDLRGSEKRISDATGVDLPGPSDADDVDVHSEPAAPGRSTADRGKRWEIPIAEWGRIRDRVHDVLREVARGRDVISYSSLVARVGHFDGPDSHALAEMLGEINAIEAPYSDEPLLISAVVTHKDDKYPGKGFFAAAAHLGMEVPAGDEEQRIFWATQLERVHEAYGRRGDR